MKNSVTFNAAFGITSSVTLSRRFLHFWWRHLQESPNMGLKLFMDNLSSM